MWYLYYKDIYISNALVEWKRREYECERIDGLLRILILRATNQ